MSHFKNMDELLERAQDWDGDFDALRESVLKRARQLEALGTWLRLEAKTSGQSAELAGQHDEHTQSYEHGRQDAMTEVYQRLARLLGTP